MALTPTEQDAATRLTEYNGGRYDASTNQHGLAGGGYKTQIPAALNDTGVVAEAVGRLAEEVNAAAAVVTPAIPIVTAARDQAVAAANTAAGIVQHVQPSEIAGIDPIIDFPFRSSTAVPSGVITGSSGKWVMGQNGLLTYVPAGTAPIEYDPITAALQGLRVEEARTTLVVKSRRLDDAAWTKSGITTGATSGADGVLGAATRLTASSANGTCIQASSSASAARRFAPFVRRVAGTGPVQMTLDGGATWTTITPTSSYVRYGVGQAVANPTVGFRLGTVGDQIDVDFANGETGAFDTSPMEAGSSLVTRSADVNTLLLSSVPGWNASEGTIYVEFETATANTGSNQFLVRASDGTYNNHIAVVLSSGAASLSTASGGVFDGNVNAGSVAANSPVKFAGAWKLNDLAASVNGGAAVADSSAVIAASLTRLDIGHDHGGLNHLVSARIRRLTIFPRRLSNATLQLLTA